MPDAASTPPRKRVREKTPTSASVTAQHEKEQKRGREEKRKAKGKKEKKGNKEQPDKSTSGKKELKKAEKTNERRTEENKKDKQRKKVNDGDADRKEKRKKEGELKEKKSDKKNDEKDGKKEHKRVKDDKQTKVCREKEKEAEKRSKKSAREESEKGKKNKKEKGEDGEEEALSKRQDRKITYLPAKKHNIEHIFKSPEQKLPARSPTTSLSSTTHAHLQELEAVLEDSDSDDESSIPAHDEEEDDEEDERSGDEEEGEDADEEDQDSDDQVDEGECSEDGDEDDIDGESLSEDEDDRTSSDGEEESEEKEKTNKGEKGAHALVKVTKETGEHTRALKNSVTNKRQWDTFVRSAKSKMPSNLADYFCTKKTECFNLWLEAGCDWDSCAMEFERLQEQKSQTKRSLKAVQGKVLKERYTAEKWEKVKKARKDANMFYWDDDFPDDEDEAWFYVKEGDEVTRKDTTKEVSKLKAKKDLDKTMRDALIDEDNGIFRPGSLPKVTAASATGSKAVLNTLDKAGLNLLCCSSLVQTTFTGKVLQSMGTASLRQGSLTTFPSQHRSHSTT